MTGLLRGTLDAAFMRGPIESGELESRELLQEQIRAMPEWHTRMN